MPGTVSRWRATYTPGRWLLLGGPTSLVVLEPAPESASTVVGTVWEAVVQSSSITELADRLAALGFDTMPSFAAFVWTDGGMRSLVRGDVVVLDAASDQPVAAGEGIQTWSEIGLEGLDVVRVTMAGEEAAGLRLPLVLGAAAASSVLLDARPAVQVRSPQPVAPAAELPRVGPGALAGRPSVSGSHLGADSGDQGPDTEPMTPPTPPSAVLPLLPQVGSEPPNGDRADARPPSAEDAAPEPTGDQLTMRLEDAAPDPGGDQLTMQLGEASPDNAGTTTLMSTAAAAAEPSVTMVLANLCPHGHSNPPPAQRCRLCGEPIPPQSPRPVPRPVIARLRVSDGSNVPVDRAVLIGRSPSEHATRAHLPHLLTVPSPNHDISRTHLQVAPDGWSVVATDLNSTNGTIVTLPEPGARRHLLTPGEPTPLPLGTLLELGDGVTLVVEKHS